MQEVPFESSSGGTVHETVGIQQISTGSDEFEWTLQKPVRDLNLFAEPHDSYDIVKLWVNGIENRNFRMDLPKCRAISWGPKKVLQPGTQIRVRVTSAPGIKIVVSIKYHWLTD
jgi:hypothetical protein